MSKIISEFLKWDAKFLFTFQRIKIKMNIHILWYLQEDVDTNTPISRSFIVSTLRWIPDMCVSCHDLQLSVQTLTSTQWFFFKSTYTWVAFIILYSGPQLWLYLQNLKQMQDAWILAKDSAWIGLGYGLFIMILKVFHFRGIWVVLLVKCWLLGSAQVMILNSWDWPPRWALLLAGNLLGTLSFSPPLSLPLSQINNLLKKKFSSLF